MQKNNRIKIYLLSMFVFLSYAPAQAMNWLPNFSKIKSSVENYYKTFVGDRLLQAAAGGNVSNIEFWLKWGAFIEFTDNSPRKFVPLYFAVSNQEHAAAEFLLKNGANIHHKNSGLSFLQIALNRGDQNMLKLLLRYKADIDEGNPNVLSWVAQWGRAEMVIILLAHGASLTKNPTLFADVLGRKNCMPWDNYLKIQKALIYAGIDTHVEGDQTAAELSQDIDVRNMIKHPCEIKKFCSVSEQIEFDEMMAQRRMVSMQNIGASHKQKNIFYKLKSRELTGTF